MRVLFVDGAIAGGPGVRHRPRGLGEQGGKGDVAGMRLVADHEGRVCQVKERLGFDLAEGGIERHQDGS